MGSQDLVHAAWGRIKRAAGHIIDDIRAHRQGFASRPGPESVYGDGKGSAT
jgi:hypothetical protein